MTENYIQIHVDHVIIWQAELNDGVFIGWITDMQYKWVKLEAMGSVKWVIVIPIMHHSFYLCGVQCYRIVKACCLVASRYFNQCWTLICDVLLYLLWSNFTVSPTATFLCNELEHCTFHTVATSVRGVNKYIFIYTSFLYYKQCLVSAIG